MKFTTRHHAKLTGIYNEPPSFKEAIQAAIFLGIPFALAVATIFTILL